MIPGLKTAEEKQKAKSNKESIYALELALLRFNLKKHYLSL